MGSVLARLHDQAGRVGELVRAEITDHKLPGTIALACNLPWRCPNSCTAIEAAERYAAEHRAAFCAERKSGAISPLGRQLSSSARAMREPTEENVAALRGAIAANNRSVVSIPFSNPTLPKRAFRLMQRRENAGAEAALRTLTFVERSGERFWLADLHRVDGQIALRRPEPDRARAEACFLKAIEIAHGQRACSNCGPPPTCPTLAPGRCAQRSSRVAGTDTRRDRGRREHQGCKCNARALLAGDRRTGVDASRRGHLLSPQRDVRRRDLQRQLYVDRDDRLDVSIAQIAAVPRRLPSFRDWSHERAECGQEQAGLGRGPRLSNCSTRGR